MVEAWVGEMTTETWKVWLVSRPFSEQASTTYEVKNVARLLTAINISSMSTVSFLVDIQS